MRTLLLLAALALLTVPATSAESGAAAACQGLDAAPCGWINPIIDLDFPDKADCGTGLQLGVEPDPSACMTPPREGEPVTLQGTLRWYWDITNEATYPNDPTQDIVISFAGTTADPDWIRFSVEPSEFVLTTVDLFDPQNLQLRQNEGTNAQLFFWYERDITVTFERVGDPTPEEVQAMQERDGLQPVYIKAKSTASGDRFREGYGIEDFRFHGANDPDLASKISKQAPAPGPFVLVALVGVAAAARRFRRN